jgi:hypothetical protein
MGRMIDHTRHGHDHCHGHDLFLGDQPGSVTTLSLPLEPRSQPTVFRDRDRDREYENFVTV